MNRARLGRRGEARAARYLRRRGLRIIERNWRTPGGELDIVARDGDQLVVVEVRTASRDLRGGPELTVGPEKQRRLARLAARYLAASRWRPDGVRFDVVGVVRHGPWSWDIRWYRNAFEIG